MSPAAVCGRRPEPRRETGGRRGRRCLRGEAERKRREVDDVDDVDAYFGLSESNRIKLNQTLRFQKQKLNWLTMMLSQRGGDLCNNVSTSLNKRW